MQRWIDYLRDLVDTGDRSGNYLRDVERWAKPGGCFSWWDGKSIYSVREVAAESFERWLSKQLIKNGPRAGEPLVKNVQTVVGESPRVGTAQSRALLNVILAPLVSNVWYLN